MNGPPSKPWKGEWGVNMRFSIFVGPCAVKQLSEKMRVQGLQVVLEGTEHILLDLPGDNVEAAIDKAMPALKAAYPSLIRTAVRAFGRR